MVFLLISNKNIVFVTIHIKLGFYAKRFRDKSLVFNKNIEMEIF